MWSISRTLRDTRHVSYDSLSSPRLEPGIKSYSGQERREIRFLRRGAHFSPYVASSSQSVHDTKTMHRQTTCKAIKAPSARRLIKRYSHS